MHSLLVYFELAAQKENRAKQMEAAIRRSKWLAGRYCILV